MRKLTSTILTALLFILTTAFAPNPPSTLEGKWLGDFKVNAKQVFFQARFWNENGEIKGSIDLPQEGAAGLELSWIIVDSNSIHFEVVRNSGTLVFDGQIKDDVVIGDFLTKADRGTFTLTRASFVGK